MRTQLIHIADTEAILRKIEEVHMPQEKELEALIKKELTKGHLFYVEKDESQSIKHGNKATLKIASNIPKFNKDKVSINVGSKLYSEIVENALIGLKVGESSTVVINNETVEFTVLKIEELFYPELTNDMVMKKEIEGIKTIEEYKDYYLAQKQNETVEACAKVCLDDLIIQSEFTEIDPLDVKEVTDQQFNVLRERFLHSDMDIEKLTDEEWMDDLYEPEKYPYYKKIYPDIAMLMGVKNKKEFYDSLYSEGVDAIRTFLVLGHFLKKEDMEEYNPTKVYRGERKLVDEYVEKIRECMMKKEGHKNGNSIPNDKRL